MTANTTYYYTVTSSDRWGNPANSIQYLFNTQLSGGSGGGGGGGGGGGDGPGNHPALNATPVITTPKPTGHVQEVTGGTGELNKTNEITGAVVGAGNTAIGYAILLILLLLILLGLYVIYDRYKYPHMDKKLIEKDLFLAQMSRQKKEEARIPKPFKTASQKIAMPKPIMPSKKINDVNDFMKNLKNGNFNKKV